MISLVLRGKLAISEDALTAAVFDCVRGSASPAELVRAMILKSRPSTRFPQFESVTIELWPAIAGAGEPDVRIVLRMHGRPVGTVLIEAKLGAQKSGAGDVSLERGTGDQLARYLIGEEQRTKAEALHLIYLTHHAACPRHELEESRARLVAAGHAHLVHRLLWLSWRDLELMFAGVPAAGDVQALLRNAKMYRFAGIPLTVSLGALCMPKTYSGEIGARMPRLPFEYAFARTAAFPQPDKTRAWTYERQTACFVWRPVQILRPATFYSR